MTLTYIFKFMNMSICRKMLKYDFYRDRYLSSNWTDMNDVLCSLDLNFQDKTFQVSILASKALQNSNITIAIRREVRYLSSNGDTANVVNHDHGLHFQGNEFWNVNISITVRASENCSCKNTIEVDSCYPVGILRMLYFITLTFIFKVKHFVVIYWLLKCTGNGCPGQICLDSHGPGHEVALVTFYSFMVNGDIFIISLYSNICL